MDNVYKVGNTNNITNRNAVYATDEIRRGYFETIFEVPIEDSVVLDFLLKKKFHELNVRDNAGTEFFDRKIINLIEPYLIELGAEYKKLSKQEIDNLTNCDKIEKNLKKINILQLTKILESNKKINKLIVTSQESTKLQLLKSQLPIFNNIIRVYSY